MTLAQHPSNSVWGDDTGVVSTGEDKGFSTDSVSDDQDSGRKENSITDDSENSDDDHNQEDFDKKATIGPPFVQYETYKKAYSAKMALLQRSLDASSSSSSSSFSSSQGSAPSNGLRNYSNGSSDGNMMPAESIDDKTATSSDQRSSPELTAETTETPAPRTTKSSSATEQQNGQEKITSQNSIPAKSTSSYQQIEGSSQIESSPPMQHTSPLLTSLAKDSNEAPAATSDDGTRNVPKSSFHMSPQLPLTTQGPASYESHTHSSEGPPSSDVTATSTGKEHAQDYMTTLTASIDTSLSQTTLPDELTGSSTTRDIAAPTNIQSESPSSIPVKTSSELFTSEIVLPSTTTVDVVPTSSSTTIAMATSSSLRSSVTPSQTFSSTTHDQRLPTSLPSSKPSASPSPETLKNSSSAPGGIAGGILGAALLLAAILAFCIVKKQKRQRAQKEDIEKRVSSGSHAYNCGACGEETGAWQEYEQGSPTNAHKTHLNYGGPVPAPARAHNHGTTGVHDPHTHLYHPEQTQPIAHGGHYYNAELSGNPPDMGDYYYGKGAVGVEDGAQYHKYWNQGYPYQQHPHQHYEGHGSYGDAYGTYGECCTGRDVQLNSPSESSRGQGITITVSPPANLERSQTIVLQSPEDTHSPNEASDFFGTTQYHQQATPEQNVSRATTAKRATKEEVTAPHDASAEYAYYHDALQLSDRKPDARDR